MYIYYLTKNRYLKEIFLEQQQQFLSTLFERKNGTYIKFIMIRPLDKAGRLRNPSEQIFNSSRCTKKVLQLKYGYIEICYQLLSVEKLVDNSRNLG